MPTMPAPSIRYGRSDPSEPAVHELPPITFGGQAVPLAIAVRRDADGMWRGRLLFGPPDAAVPTGEIVCAHTEAEFWMSVRGLNTYHLRDLYRSLTG